MQLTYQWFDVTSLPDRPDLNEICNLFRSNHPDYKLTFRAEHLHRVATVEYLSEDGQDWLETSFSMLDTITPEQFVEALDIANRRILEAIQ